MCSDVRSEIELRMRMEEGANTWMQVGGVMDDRHI